ncbi:uroporphyrinogen decarboxylase family protein [Blautia producta]|uniref:uroporphyrinogen decarboxylase family protein n=1 Tax=Blautia producta TaxID=33035 RepID=UPI001022C3F9|nr:uroporphyrinogen decarboxylase family protein [Blautia producta]
MLTIKQNLLETIHGGEPDRFVNQFEYLAMVSNPALMASMGSCPQGSTSRNGWGVTIAYPLNVPGPFPMTKGDLVVVKDVARWRDYVKAPPTRFPEEAWKPFVEMADSIDREEQFVAAFEAPGIFEKLHYLMGMEEALINFYEEPGAMHELIDFLADYEIESAKEVIPHLHPDAVFHHDDWGSHISSFLSPEMFDEFLLPAYKRIYGFWRENGVELIVHHSDSYAANLVPSMIKMGVDIWQGPVTTNNIPELIKTYGGQISFHGGIDNGVVDRENWSKENIMKYARQICQECGRHYFIPGGTVGGPGSTYPGVYEAIAEVIDELSREEQFHFR